MSTIQATVHEANQFRQTGKMPESLKERVQEAKEEASKETDKPNSSAKKADLQAYLDAEGIEYEDDATNKELHSLIE